MRSVLISFFSAALLAGAVGIAQAEQGSGGTFAATEIHYGDAENVGGDRWRFRGHIESEKNKCEPDRTVKMFKSKNGEWVFADKDKTDAMGGWKTVDRLPGKPPLKFTVTKENVGGVTCGSDSIKPFQNPMRRG